VYVKKEQPKQTEEESGLDKSDNQAKKVKTPPSSPTKVPD